MEKVIGFSASDFVFAAEFFSCGLRVPDIFQRARNHCGTSPA